MIEMLPQSVLGNPVSQFGCSGTCTRHKEKTTFFYPQFLISVVLMTRSLFSLFSAKKDDFNSLLPMLTLTLA